MTDQAPTFDDIDEALGLKEAAADRSLAASFREAGFDDIAAAQGVRMWGSGRYFSFEDVAMSLRERDPARHRITEDRIREVAATIPTTLALSERRTPEQTRPRLLESATARAAGEGLLDLQVISAGEGSSGYYPASTLQEAARSKVFGKGLHCYLDHSSRSEALDRPERSVAQLVGCLESDATFAGDALHAKVRLFSSHRDFLLERASAIGVSISADGQSRARESVGGRRQTPIVEKIVRARSVDFVTHAGRGGRITSW